MSLVSDALKKAQRMRQQEQATPGTVAPGVPRRGGGRSGGQMLTVWAAIAVAVIAVAVAVAISLLQTGPAETVARPNPSTAPTLNPASAPPPAAELVLAAPPPAAAIPPVKIEGPPLAAAPSAPDIAQAPASAAPTVRAAKTPDARIQEFIDNMNIAGSRLSDTDSRAVIGGKVYRVNDFIDRTLGVRLTEITETHLVFTDEAGATYTRNR